MFSQAFYRLLSAGAEELGLTRGALAIRALKFYLKEARKKSASQLTETVGEDSAKEYSRVQSKLSKDYWATVPEAERKRRAEKAAEGRWGKPTKKK